MPVMHTSKDLCYGVSERTKRHFWVLLSPVDVAEATRLPTLMWPALPTPQRASARMWTLPARPWCVLKGEPTQPLIGFLHQDLNQNCCRNRTADGLAALREGVGGMRRVAPAGREHRPHLRQLLPGGRPLQLGFAIKRALGCGGLREPISVSFVVAVSHFCAACVALWTKCDCWLLGSGCYEWLLHLAAILSK